MTKATLDTNVLVTGFLRRPNIQARLIEAWIDEVFDLILSNEILAEVRRAFAKPYFREHLSPEQIGAAIELLRIDASIVSLTATVVGVAAHPHDDLIIATALSGKADYLVTGDRELLRLRVYEGVRIVSPREFLDILAAMPDDDL